MEKHNKIIINLNSLRCFSGLEIFHENQGQKNEAVQLELVPEKALLLIRIRIDLAFMDLDPYWECGSGSRTRGMEIDQH
jgi:hypothetical protein